MYSITVRFATKEASGKAYRAAYSIVSAHTRLDISVFQYLHIRLNKWCVSLIGNRPSERFRQQFEHALGAGTIVQLTDTELAKLLERRFTNLQPGGFIEYHFDPGEVV